MYPFHWIDKQEIFRIVYRHKRLIFRCIRNFISLFCLCFRLKINRKSDNYLALYCWYSFLIFVNILPVAVFVYMLVQYQLEQWLQKVFYRRIYFQFFIWITRYVVSFYVRKNPKWHNRTATIRTQSHPFDNHLFNAN
jgi:hypothetical protein